MFNFQRPTSSESEFKTIVKTLTDKFPQNSFCKKVDSGKLTLKDYQTLLCNLFFQPFYGSNALALAGSNLDIYRREARDYLILHAEEEKKHWEWILNDLRATGYEGPDITSKLPPVNTQTYIAFNYFIAMKAPFARLAIATMLESIGATHGKNYATKIQSTLNLKPQQISFFFGHGDTDVGHTKDLFEIIESCKFSSDEWAWMTYAAEAGFRLYSRIYDDLFL